MMTRSGYIKNVIVRDFYDPREAVEAAIAQTGATKVISYQGIEKERKQSATTYSGSPASQPNNSSSSYTSNDAAYGESQSTGFFDSLASGFNKPRSSYTSDATGYRDAIETVADAAGAVLVLGAKGIWKAGKFGARKIRERNEQEKTKEMQEIQELFHSFFERPRSHSVRWLFGGGEVDVQLDGSETLAIIATPEIMLGWLDDVLDDMSKSDKNYSLWLGLEEICKDLDRAFSDSDYLGLSFSDDGLVCRLDHIEIESFYVVIKLFVDLMERYRYILDQGSVKLLKRLSSVASAIESRLGDDFLIGNNQVVAASGLTALLQVEPPNTPLDIAHLQAGGKDGDIGSSSEVTTDEPGARDSYFQDTRTSDVDYQDNSDCEQDFSSCENSAPPTLSDDDYTVYSCHLYLPSRQSPTGWWGNEGAFVITQDTFLFIMEDDYDAMSLESLSKAISNDKHPLVSWRCETSEVASLLQKKEFFRSVLYLNLTNGKKTRVIFSPGAMSTVYDRIARLTGND